MVYYLLKFGCFNILYRRFFVDKENKMLNRIDEWNIEKKNFFRIYFLIFLKIFKKIYLVIFCLKNYVDKKGENNEVIECFDDFCKK